MGKSTVLGCAVLLLAGIAAAPVVVADTPSLGGNEARRARDAPLPARRQVVTSQVQWEQWLRSPEHAASPFARLDAQRQAAFSHSLVFRDGMLVSYDHDILLPFFAAADAYQVLGVFGLEHELAFLPGVRLESVADRDALHAASSRLAARHNPFAMTEIRDAVAAGDWQPAQRWSQD